MSETKIKKRILFVDDSSEFLEIFTHAVSVHSKGEWEIFCAPNAGKALAVLEEHPMHLVVIDVQMPLVDGLQLLKLIVGKYPHLPKAVLTGSPSAEDRATSLASGAELYLEKPTTPEGVEAIYLTLNELAKVEAEEGFQGTIRRVGLHDILQMECLGRNSAILEVFNKETRGEIFIRNGAIIHAQTHHLTGQDAFFFLLSVSGGGFKLKPYVAPSKVTITKSWEHLLMESANLRDESAENAEAEAAGLTGEATAEQHPHAAPLRLPQINRTTQKREPVQVNEMAVFSLQGDVLYEWQCPDIELRKRLMEMVSEKSKEISKTLNLGQFDLVEMHSPKSRIIAQVQTDAGVYMHASKSVAAN
jgi:CheY-like chemotaxis protein